MSPQDSLVFTQPGPQLDVQMLFCVKVIPLQTEEMAMSNCRSATYDQSHSPNRYRCPVNGVEYSRVPMKTILHDVVTPWEREIKEQGYYFCEDQKCDVVYFGQDDTVIERSSLRLPVGVKDNAPDSLVCYCFDVTKSDAIKTPMAREYITKKTKEKMCSCETRNPSGRCCLKDFPSEEHST